MINKGDIVITLENIHKQFAEKLLLRDASFGIHHGDRIGLIGVNGCGKTTLLKLLAGTEPPDAGKITFRNELKLSYLPQNPNLDQNLTVMEQVFKGDLEIFRVLRQYHRVTYLLSASFSDELYKEQQHLAEQIEFLHGWDMENQVRTVLSIFGITDDQQLVGTLSGGQKRKIDLARVLLERPDILLLDEPTNHLDIDAIEWLQEYLENFKGTLLFVTHDRYFLDGVSNRVMEMDKGEVNFFSGNYSRYLEKKEMEAAHLQRRETRRAAILRKEIKWLQRGAKARTSKPKSHIDRVKELIDKSYLTTQQDLSISFQIKRLGKTILEAHQVSMSYGKKSLFTNFSHVFQAMERIGIIGDNGCGKTTLINILNGLVEPVSGSVKIGVNTLMAYYKQELEEMPLNITVIDYIKEQAEYIRTKDGALHSAHEMLERFLFDGKMQQSKISSLSGGERKRLYLLRSLMFGSNFLILDEPTNDLDIPTLEILEDYLDAYKGCILVVSHDRFFLDRVVDYLFLFEQDGIRKFPGNYSDYLLVKRFQVEEREEREKSQNVKQTTERVQKKLSFKDQKELDELEGRITELENEQNNLNERLSELDLKPEDYAVIDQELKKIEEELSDCFERWTELEEKRVNLIK
ncbi:MAG TPA: ABC-F family ATP-binding cassette domain-containing protein [Candidatus Cloacimonadota bacterium]|nr:ABC-F family ATP-binding cassette domain-containing protein [Candidatus Cloacimonadota bacterium]